MSLSYNDVVGMLFSDGVRQYVPLGLAHSLPMIGLENGGIVDCFFLFAYANDNRGFFPPIACLATDPCTQKLVYHKDSEALPFERRETVQSLPLSFTSTKDERREAMKLYREHYTQVRDFAFHEHLAPDEINLLWKFNAAFEALTASQLKEYYAALSPVYTQWVLKMMG